MAEGIAIPHPSGKSIIKSSTPSELIRDKTHHTRYKAFNPPERSLDERSTTEKGRAETRQRDLLAAHEQVTRAKDEV